MGCRATQYGGTPCKPLADHLGGLQADPRARHRPRPRAPGCRCSRNCVTVRPPCRLIRRRRPEWIFRVKLVSRARRTTWSSTPARADRRGRLRRGRAPHHRPRGSVSLATIYKSFPSRDAHGVTKDSIKVVVRKPPGRGQWKHAFGVSGTEKCDIKGQIPSNVEFFDTSNSINSCRSSKRRQWVQVLPCAVPGSAMWTRGRRAHSRSGRRGVTWTRSQPTTSRCAYVVSRTSPRSSG